MFTAVNMCIYNGPLNTFGVGDPVPYGSAATFGIGSGDRFDFGPGWGKKKNFNKSTPAYQQYKPFMKKPAQMLPACQMCAPRPLLVMAKGTNNNRKSTKRKNKRK